MNKKIKTDDSVSTIVKIQKLIESLQKKHSASTENNNNIKIKNEEKYDINYIKKQISNHKKMI